jgi:hypothetical protein
VDGLSPARALTGRAARVGGAADRRLETASPAAPFTIHCLTPTDDSAIRALLRDASFGEDVALSLEREPDSALASSIEGDEHVALGARHRTGAGRLAGIASRAVRTVFVNGEARRIGYLGQLRIDPAFRRHRGLLAAGFEYIRSLDSGPAGPRLYLASVVADNTAARRLLARRAAGWPAFEPVDTLVSLTIPVGGRPGLRAARGLECARGSLDRIDDVGASLQRAGRRHQFHPAWSRADLLSPLRSRGLSPEDFILATRDGRVVGCLACWDQRAFKQVVVRRYSPRIARWRPLLNVLAPFTGMPHLPATGDALQFAFLSHLALDAESDAAALIAMVHAARAEAGRRGLRYVVLGVSAAHPLLPDLRRAFSHRAYESVLYVAFWPEGAALAASLDGRPSHPELAIL